MCKRNAQNQFPHFFPDSALKSYPLIMILILMAATPAKINQQTVAPHDFPSQKRNDGQVENGESTRPHHQLHPEHLTSFGVSTSCFGRFSPASRVQQQQQQHEGHVIFPMVGDKLINPIVGGL